MDRGHKCGEYELYRAAAIVAGIIRGKSEWPSVRGGVKRPGEGETKRESLANAFGE